MTNLKTLKDFKVFATKEGNLIRKDKLRAEAIKWVKEDIRLDGCIIQRTKTWMKRLDLTEDDLQ